MKQSSIGSVESGIQNTLLTEEQLAIINSTGNIRINAVAGSGKTTILIEYARSRPSSCSILYLAFNKSVKLEAVKKFADQGLSNVKVETAHSLAFKDIVRRYNYKLRSLSYTTYDIAEILRLESGNEKHTQYIIANHINKFISYFCNSDKERVQDLNYLDVVKDPKAKAFAKTFYRSIEKGTRAFLAKMDKGEIEVTHDFYLKKFQLSKPQLNYDYILFDEGQDASSAMLDVFLNQKATKLIVGDTHQQIYGWRFAVNSLEKVDFKTYDLSISFRFSPDIANLAMQILQWKNHLKDDQKLPKILGKGSSGKGKSKATIARTNLGLLTKAISFISEHTDVKHIYFEGNFNSYTYADDGASLYDVLNLYNKKFHMIRDKLVKSMKDLDDLEEYIEKSEDVQLGLMVEIVKEYENEIPELIRRLKEKQVDISEKEKAEMIFSTVHKAKGMEYHAVQLVEDFIVESKLEKIKIAEKKEEANLDKYNEEINLLYVALTRAKGLIRMPESMMPKNFPVSSFVEIIQTRKEEPASYSRSHFLPPDLEMINMNSTIERKFTDKIDKYSDHKRKHKNAYQPWTTKLDEELKDMYYKAVKLDAIAEHFGRNKGAIVSRLYKIGCLKLDE